MAREFLKLAGGVEVAAGAAPVPGAAVAPASADEKEMEAVEEKSATARSSAPAVESVAEPCRDEAAGALADEEGARRLGRTRKAPERLPPTNDPRKKPLWLRKELAGGTPSSRSRRRDGSGDGSGGPCGA